MLAYILRRLLLIMPTLFGIMVINFVIVQVAPGGPVEQMIAADPGHGGDATDRVSGGGRRAAAARRRQRGGERRQPIAARAASTRSSSSASRSMFGFDKPTCAALPEMIGELLCASTSAAASSATAAWSTSSSEDAGVDLARPVDHAAGLPDLDPARHRQGGARRQRFDSATSARRLVGYAIPGFLFAILLVVLFAGGSFVQWFPLRGLVSDDWAQPGPGRHDRSTISGTWCCRSPRWSIGGFASLTMLTKNSLPRGDRQAVRA